MLKDNCKPLTLWDQKNCLTLKRCIFLHFIVSRHISLYSFKTHFKTVSRHIVSCNTPKTLWHRQGQLDQFFEMRNLQLREAQWLAQDSWAKRSNVGLNHKKMLFDQHFALVLPGTIFPSPASAFYIISHCLQVIQIVSALEVHTQ